MTQAVIFLVIGLASDLNVNWRSSASELRLEYFAKDEILQQNTELPLQASEQENRAKRIIKWDDRWSSYLIICFVSSKRTRHKANALSCAFGGFCVG